MENLKEKESNHVRGEVLYWGDFIDLKNQFNRNIGDVKIERNLIRISTGGWSDNEELMSTFKKSVFHALYFSAQMTGGHYYYDLDRNNKNASHWTITKN